MEYSKGQFGFSVQKQIWQSVGGRKNSDYQVMRRFGKRVGWFLRPGSILLLNLNDKWVSPDDIREMIASGGNINQTPKGFLPLIIWSYIPKSPIGKAVVIREFLSANITFGNFFARVETCKV